MTEPQPSRWKDLPISIIAVLLILFVLRAVSLVILPLVLAGFLAILFWPLLYRLDQRLPRWVGIVLVLGILLVVTAGLGWFLSFMVAELGGRADFYVLRLEAKLQGLTPLAERFGILLDANTFGGQRLLSLLGSGVQITLTILAFVGFLFFVLALLLIELPLFQRKLMHGLSGEGRHRAISAVEEIVRTFKHFFLVQTFVSVLTGLGTGIFLTLAGVEFAWVWAGVAFILNFIPSIGSIIAVIPPVLVAAIQFDSLLQPLFVLVMLAIIQNVIGNYMNPRLMGRTVSLSPLVVLLSVLFWGWYWGAIGFFLAVPLTLVVRIVCAHVDGLEPIALFLGNGAELRDEGPVPPPEAMSEAARLDDGPKLGEGPAPGASSPPAPADHPMEDPGQNVHEQTARRTDEEERG